MENFAQMAHDWANFYSALAQVSGALVGLVFVALTFKPKTLAAGEDPLLGALARQTFADFMLLLVISMLMLVPHYPAGDVAAAMLVAIALGSVRILRDLARLHMHLRRMKVVQRFVLSLSGHAMLGIAAVELMHGLTSTATSGAFMLAGTLILLVSGCRSAWLLVVHEPAV